MTVSPSTSAQGLTIREEPGRLEELDEAAALEDAAEIVRAAVVVEKRRSKVNGVVLGVVGVLAGLGVGVSTGSILAALLSGLFSGIGAVFLAAPFLLVWGLVHRGRVNASCTDAGVRKDFVVEAIRRELKEPSESATFTLQAVADGRSLRP